MSELIVHGITFRRRVDIYRVRSPHHIDKWKGRLGDGQILYLDRGWHSKLCCPTYCYAWVESMIGVYWTDSAPRASDTLNAVYEPFASYGDAVAHALRKIPVSDSQYRRFEHLALPEPEEVT